MTVYTLKTVDLAACTPSTKDIVLLLLLGVVMTAAAYIELPGAGAAAPTDAIIDFILDRPFIFVITSQDNLPLFAGTVNQP